ncbi:MAG: YbhB/YbcL family Raf kinase inhibitor-like protein [Alphaproteobacteria bacterium]|nr:YbhB/YbcL family Raf kinase inhibitor-like protein [Alphaproteobacteria bacterium]MBT5390099.1 YbhB/YbcL family Raf kinase inhibitor-like protein [Alphaproteobacteria bacterium]MBT5654745.1 YbhB/YbcL family Raf kinase inhibitor-like protein [Alphaproteobacteria bacterium]
MALTITSPAFTHGEMIPDKYTCDGEDISIPLKWDGVPEGTQTLALIFDDPDAPMGTWDHWVLYNIPPNTPGLAENISTLPAGTKAAENSWGKKEYGGPCPPDRIHRYYFKLYALNSELDSSLISHKKSLQAAMADKIIEQAELRGTYDKRERRD